jgi:hypothetical protein
MAASISPRMGGPHCERLSGRPSMRLPPGASLGPFGGRVRTRDAPARRLSMLGGSLRHSPCNSYPLPASNADGQLHLAPPSGCCNAIPPTAATMIEDGSGTEDAPPVAPPAVCEPMRSDQSNVLGVYDPVLVFQTESRFHAAARLPLGTGNIDHCVAGGRNSSGRRWSDRGARIVIARAGLIVSYRPGAAVRHARHTLCTPAGASTDRTRHRSTGSSRRSAWG